MLPITENTLQVALFQMPLVWENPKANREAIDQKIAQLPDTVALIVLPEMFTTGFTMNASKNAENIDGETTAWLQKKAQETQAALVGSIIVKEKNSYYNRLLFTYPSGEIMTYDKRHLFSYAGENNVYTAGNKKLIVTLNGWKICPLLCYDLRFPVWSRNTENYDLLLYIANWPKARINAWDTLLKARAIENLSYCIGTNRVGIDSNSIEYPGHTAVYNALGEIISGNTENQEAVILATLAKNHLSETRERFQFLNDRDTFDLK